MEHYYAIVNRFSASSGYTDTHMTRDLSPHDVLFFLHDDGIQSRRILTVIVWSDGDGAAIGVTGDWCAVRFDDINPMAIEMHGIQTFDAGTWKSHITAADKDESVMLLGGLSRSGKVTPEDISAAVRIAEQVT